MFAIPLLMFLVVAAVAGGLVLRGVRAIRHQEQGSADLKALESEVAELKERQWDLQNRLADLAERDDFDRRLRSGEARNNPVD